MRSNFPKLLITACLAGLAALVIWFAVIPLWPTRGKHQRVLDKMRLATAIREHKLRITEGESVFQRADVADFVVSPDLESVTFNRAGHGVQVTLQYRSGDLIEYHLPTSTTDHTSKQGSPSEGEWTFYFYFKSEASAQAVAKLLEEKSFSARVSTAAVVTDDLAFSCIATKQGIDVSEFEELDQWFESIAEKHGGEYDGWDRPAH